ncbi:choice-of-anchor C family protein [Streptomyces ipomoeae]|uniref:choice-of-anchor C family protein n=1 Tax=Streptomyces ipomoeae TaxID=103232 RepID=UPI00114721D1|nr:choice-of-anchor C family protein [Streptomyces ipomoeae]MDX2936980.1 choice-of-anchor C family protein [Streptomyces ipomoeae]TQE20125.1 choice-of-anchor C family protein [Streptomyces ipomoeae]
MPVRTRLAALAAVCLLAGTGSAVAAERGGTASLSAVSVQAELFSNGSFETPTVREGAALYLPAGQTIGPWLVASGSVDHIGPGYWQAADGVQSLDLNGLGPGAVSQTFATIPQQRYTLTYALAGNPNGLPTVKTGRVVINGETVQDFIFDATGKTRANMGWETRTVNFTATSSSTTLTFESTTIGPNGPAIDNVKICGCS